MQKFLKLKGAFIIPLFIFTLAWGVGFLDAAESPHQKRFLFQGRVKSDNVNIRTDSTSTSEIIYKACKNECLDVIREFYDWYKVRLPESAPAYIKKDFIEISGDNIAKVSADKVNIRLRPDMSSAILGKAEKDEAVNIVEDIQGWYKIEPLPSCFGWVHKNFLQQADEQNLKCPPKAKKDAETAAVPESLTLEGMIKPKTFTRIASHKLITSDNEVFLLKGNKEELTALNYRKVKISGKSIPSEYSNPIVEIEKIEALD